MRRSGPGSRLLPGVFRTYAPATKAVGLNQVMGEFAIGLLIALGVALGLLAGWRIQRQRAEMRRRVAAEATRKAAEREARAQAEIERAAEARARAERDAAARVAAEQAAAAAERERAALDRAEAARRAAARAEAERLAAARAEAEAKAEAEAEAERRAAALRAAAAQEASERAAQRQAAAAPAAAPPPCAAKSADRTLVMVADDSKVVRIKTGRLLAQQQYQVCYAEDGLDALRQLRDRVPDIVITDVEMPGMDGFELTRQIRGEPLTAHIPVIMITAADDRHREQAREVGVSVLLGKPYPEDALLAHIRRAMGQDEGQPRSAGVAGAPTALH